MKTNCFIGLGTMGSQIARHIKERGLDLTVFNRTEEKAVKWVENNGGKFSRSPI